MNANKGIALVASDAPFPPITDGVTVFFCAAITSTMVDLIEHRLTRDPTLFILRNANPAAGVGQGSIIKLSILHASVQQLQVTVWDQSTHASTTTVLTGPLFETWKTYAVCFNRTSWTAYGNGGAIGSGSCNLVSSFNGINVSGEADQFFSGNPYQGYLAHVTVFDRILSEGDIFQLSVAGQLGYGSQAEVTSDRVQRKLDTINMKTGRIMDNSGQTWLDAEGTDNSTVADLNNQVAAYEDAYIFEDAAGVYQYRPPARYAFQQSRAVLGENVAGGEIPYQPGPEIDFDPTYLYNNITILNSVFATTITGVPGSTVPNLVSGIRTTTFGAQDDPSALKYGLRTFSRDTRLAQQTEEEVFYLAYWLLSQYASTKQRFQTVTIDPGSNPTLWTFCLTVEVADVLTVVRRPIGAPTISADCVVMQVEHDTSAGNFRTTLYLAPARSSGLILNDPVQGIAGDNFFTME
jgi:hypothetical protein